MTDEPPPLPRCICWWQQDFHDDNCPHYQEILARAREWERKHP